MEELSERREFYGGGFLAVKDAPGQFDGTERGVIGPAVVQLLGGGAQEGEIERGVMGNERAPRNEFEERGKDDVDSRSVSHLLVGDAREFLDEGGDGLFWVNESCKLFLDDAACYPDCTDLCDGINAGCHTGRFKVDDDEGGVTQWCGVGGGTVQRETVCGPQSWGGGAEDR